MQAATIVLLFAMAPAYAIDAGTPDLAAGQARAESTCSLCHGKDFKGLPFMKAPSLIGKDAAYLTEQLKAFRAGTRHTNNAAMMAPNAKGLTDNDISNVVAYLTSLK